MKLGALFQFRIRNNNSLVKIIYRKDALKARRPTQTKRSRNLCSQTALAFTYFEYLITVFPKKFQSLRIHCDSASQIQEYNSLKFI